jgi:flagellar motor switch protein FliG
MSTPNYQQLSKLQKLAIFLIVIGPETAAEILRQFEDAEIEAICREMTHFQVIEPEMQNTVIEEFSKLIMESFSSLSGGASFARRALELATGDSKAASILERISPGGNSADCIKEIGEMEPQQIFNLIKTEQSQTIAFILSYLEMEKAADILPMLHSEVREEVVERLGTLDVTSLELVNKVAKSLTHNLDHQEKPTMHSSGGVRPAAELLNSLDREESKNILTKMEERNPELSNAIRKKMFGFADLIRLEQKDLQRIMREIDTSDLVLALKTATPLLNDAICGAISKRAAETLKEELEMLGSVRLKDVEAAQDRVIQIVRRLEEQEEISLEKGGAGVVN